MALLPPLEDEENLSPELRRGCVFTLVKDNCPAGVASALAIASPEKSFLWTKAKEYENFT
jgi:hypothetical protein